MGVNFGRLVRQLAVRHRDREALVNIERNRRYTFGELHTLTNKIANMLRDRLAVGPGDRFFLILENDNLALLQFPTFLKQAGTAAMANLRESLDEHRWQAELIAPKIAFLETRLVETHAAMFAELGCTMVVMDPLSAEQANAFPDVLQFWDLIAEASDRESDVLLDERTHIALMRFTGGTTGRGKCALYSPENWIAGRDSSYINSDLGFDAQTRFLHAAPLSHGTQLFLYPTFFAGGASITMNALDLTAFCTIAEKEAVTHSFLVPTVLYRMLELQRTDPKNLGSLRTLIYGAAPISPTRLSELIDCFGPIFVQAYAATEAVAVVSFLDRANHRADSPAAEKRLASAGCVTPGIEVLITDEQGREVAEGETGEIRIRSRAVIQGYLGNPEANATDFEDGAWRSGDVGYIDEDGYLFIVDRLKDMIISGGFNIYAVEVEAALASHPAVLNSAVVGLPHPEWGEAVHAEVQLREGQLVEASVLVEHVKQRLASYKAPKSVSFSDALPLTSVGKVLRRKVREVLLGAAAQKSGETEK